MKLCLLLLGMALALPAAAHTAARFEIEQHLGAALPLDTPLTDSSGRSAPLAAQFGGPPVVLLFGYLSCPNLCDTTRRGVAEALARSGVPARALFVSIDPDERGSVQPPWRLLKGDEAAVRRLARTVGFPYEYDARTKQYVHPAGFVVATPEGTIARYFPGVRFDSAELRAALLDAAQERTGGLAGSLLLLCRHLDPAGRYTDAILGALRLSIFAFLLAAGFFLWRMRKR